MLNTPMLKAASALVKPAIFSVAMISSASTATTISPAISSLVAKATHGMAQVVKTQNNPNGLTEVMVTGKPGTPAAGRKAVFWYLPKKNDLVIGSVFNKDGRNLTVQAGQQSGFAAPTPHTSALLSAYKPGTKQYLIIKSLQSSKGFYSFKEGHGPNHITAIIDPNCIFCHLWWTDLQNVKNWQNQYTVTWIPVGFLKPSSAGKAAALLKGGYKALDQNESKFVVIAEEGSIAPIKTETLVKDVIKNTNLWEIKMSALRLQAGTPTLITKYGVFAGAIPPAALVAKK